MTTITISKEDFEQALPVGCSAHSEVFESVMPAIDIANDNYSSNLLGEAGLKRIAEEGENGRLLQYYKIMVCVDGFLSVFRQLDLLLTPTGFGIVSNDTISPASKQRVDALEGQLRTALCRARAMAVDLLRSKEWGKTMQAKNYIRYIYTENYFFFSPMATKARSYQDWQAMQRAIIDADETLRLRISDEQMDDILDAWRCNDHDRLTPYAGILQLICDFTDIWNVNGKAAISTPLYRRIEREVEQNPEIYSIYPETAAYDAAHIEHFKNTKDSSAFVFNG